MTSEKATCVLDIADYGGATLEEISEIMGVTRERIRQIEGIALKKYRKRMDKVGRRSQGDSNPPSAD